MKKRLWKQFLATGLIVAILMGCQTKTSVNTYSSDGGVSGESISDQNFSSEPAQNLAQKSEEGRQQQAQTLEELYQGAVRDSVFAEEDEIFPLVNLTKEDPRVTWDDAGKRVLLLTYHHFPDSYPEGKEITLSWGEGWTFTDGELAEWYQKNKDGVTDWTLRFHQLIGVPADKGHTHISGFWVKPEDIKRPAYISDPVAQMQTHFAEGEDEEYIQWFNGNIIWSYFDSAYPWTRLGYTYDWADNGSEYGLSEFLVRKEATVEVAFTYTIDEMVEWLENR